MTDHQGSNKSPPDQEELMRRWTAIGEQSRQVAEAFAERQAEGNYSVVDPQSVARAFTELGVRMMADPGKLAEAQVQLWQESMKLWQSSLQRMMGGGPAEPIAEPERGDRRFKDAAWNEEALFDYVKQSYLLSSRWLQGVVHDVEGLDPKTRDKLVSSIPLGRLAETADVVGPTLFLASPASNFVTGQVLYVDGGITANR